jgi:hypothetical protein
MNIEIIKLNHNKNCKHFQLKINDEDYGIFHKNNLNLPENIKILENLIYEKIIEIFGE